MRPVKGSFSSSRESPPTSRECCSGPLSSFCFVFNLVPSISGAELYSALQEMNATPFLQDIHLVTYQKCQTGGEVFEGFLWSQEQCHRDVTPVEGTGVFQSPCLTNARILSCYTVRTPVSMETPHSLIRLQFINLNQGELDILCCTMEISCCRVAHEDIWEETPEQEWIDKNRLPDRCRHRHGVPHGQWSHLCHPPTLPNLQVL